MLGLWPDHQYDVFTGLEKTLRKHHFTNPYGLFRQMTGVGGRPELILEGSDGE